MINLFLCANGADYCEFDDKLSVHIPSSPKAPCYHAHVSCPLSFVTNKECGEEPCTGQVAPKAIDYHQGKVVCLIWRVLVIILSLHYWGDILCFTIVRA